MDVGESTSDNGDGQRESYIGRRAPWLVMSQSTMDGHTKTPAWTDCRIRQGHITCRGKPKGRVFEPLQSLTQNMPGLIH